MVFLAAIAVLRDDSRTLIGDESDDHATQNVDARRAPRSSAAAI